MSADRFNQIEIETPEGVVFVHQLASPVVRFLALAIDLAASSTIVSVLSAAVLLLRVVSADLAYAAYALVYFAVSIGYFIVLEMVWRGRTIGKRLLKLQVIDAGGLRLKPSQIVVRNLLRFVDSLPVLYFLGGACALLNPRFQRLGDIAAGTVVVRVPKIQAPELKAVIGSAHNSFREHPRIEARLRQNTPPELAEIALQALRRRDEFEPRARTALFSEIAAELRECAAFPESIVESISDEQYVRNCVESIYRGER